MKILKHGNKQKLETHVGTCKHCGCKVEVGRSEIQKIFDQRDGNYAYVNCPECRFQIYFDPEKV